MTWGKKVTCCKNLYLEEDKSVELYEKEKRESPLGQKNCIRGCY